MATNSKGPMAIAILGFALAVLGLIFLMTGRTTIGLTMGPAGLVFIAVGLAAARKAASGGK